MFETLIVTAQGFLSHFSDPVGKFPFTYQGEIIDKAYEADECLLLYSVDGSEEII